MKHIIFWMSMVLVLMLLALPVSAQENAEGEDETNVEIRIGAWNGDADGSPDVVTEYEPDSEGIDVGVSIDGEQDWGHLDLDARLRHVDDQSLSLGFDVRRILRSQTDYMRMLHRLGHDPLDTMAAVTNHGRIVQHTDLDPDDEYQISYSDLRHKTEYQPSEAFTVGLIYRNQQREGLKQALTVSHCDSCHLYSQSRPIDEETEDAGIEATYAWKGGVVKASFVHREHDEGVGSLSLLFDNALQPELLTPIFDNRLQWDSAQGAQPVHQKPDITKDIGRIDFAFPNVGGFVFNFGGVWSSTENDTTGLSSDYTGYLLNAARNYKDWRFRWRGRFYSIDNDVVFVDILEPPGIAGPHNGVTYREAYGFDPDFVRLSALDRDVIESRFDASYKIGKKVGTVKFLWDLEAIDRDHYEVAPGETKTTENILGVTWSARPKKGVRVHGALRHGEVDNPFMLPNGGFSTLVSQRVASPFDPSAAQYFDFQDARIADTTAAPESWDELKIGISKSKEKMGWSASYRYWDGDNDGDGAGPGMEDSDLTDWSRTTQALNVSVWMAPEETWNWHLGYTLHDMELNFPTFIPIFDG